MKWIRAIAGLLALLAATAASAQDYPNRPITMVVPFPPGGSVDTVSRQIAAGLSRHIGQSVVVENKSGAGGTIGSGMVAKAAPDGYTILLGTTSALAISPAVYKDVSYDPLKSFVPLIEVTRGPFVVSVRPTLGVKDIRGLIDMARKNPGKLNAGSAGKGSVHHLALEIFKHEAGVDIVHVPFKGGAPAWTALLGGQIDLLFDSMPGPLLFPGRVVPLAVAGPERLPGLPDVPTFAEVGMPNVSTIFFWAIVAPVGTPAPIVAKLNEALGKALRDPAMKETFAKQSMETSPGTPEEIASFMQREVPRWREVVRRAKLGDQ